MSKVMHTGSWFLPNSDKKYPGQIVVDDKSIRLEIFSDESIEGKQVTDLLKAEIVSYHPIILGIANGLITLYNCQWVETNPVGTNLAKTIYEASYSFLGGHIVDEREIMIKSGTFTFPDIVSWYDGWESLDKIPVSDSSDREYSEIKTNQFQSEQIVIDKSLSIILSDVYDKAYPNLGFHHSVKYRKLVHFFYEKPVHFKTLIEDASIFRRLLEFNYGQPLEYKIFRVGVPKNNIQLAGELLRPTGNNILIDVGNFTLNNGKRIEQTARHQNYMLVSGWNTKKEDLNAIICKWFSNKQYFGMYDYYLDSNNWFQGSEVVISNVMFNNRFLNLVQGLESFYNKKIKKILQQVMSLIRKKKKC